ncbi:MAG: glycosyltransferase [Kiloniellales bacterium]|nr:glycosyltransferase [Kiloniellales bacterium]
MSRSADILFYVQHLLGIGHLRRSAAIVRALDAAGLRVVLVSGGLPVQNLDIANARLVQLPPLKSPDERFSRLVDAAGEVVDEAWKAARAARLLDVFQAARPRLLVTEMFPLGRRQMRFELLPLLEAAIQGTPRPAIVCSVRDILNEPRSADKSRWMAATLDRYFDRVLVHGDPEIATLDLTFPRIAEVTPEVTYTGYVVSEAPARPEPNAAPDAAGTGEVLVSAGGGRVAGPLIEAVLAARPRGPLKDAQWRILVGEHTPQAAYEAWVRRAPAGVTVERWRPDFQALLSRSLLSISQAGYNTVMEVLKSGRPALVVPFAAGSETEQSRRASLLADRGLLVVINEAELSAERLNRGLRQALAQADRPPARPIDMAGARKTAAILQDMLATLPR